MLRSTARVILRRVVLQVEETSAYCTVNHWASASNYQLSNMKRPARDSNRQIADFEKMLPPFQAVRQAY